jgi:hypothetical protein
MHAAHSSTLRLVRSLSARPLTMSAIASLPPGRSTRAASAKTRPLTGERLMRQLHSAGSVDPPLLKRDPDALRDQLCIGPAEKCAELLSRYAEAGCERVHLWPLGDEPQQIELAATAVLPAVEA